ncbi:MAG: IS110 family transposase [Lentisphaeria bacterium]|nr:IS110 family transposase [Lentisphaeria bacterium]
MINQRRTNICKKKILSNLYIGVDLGDKTHFFCILDADGNVVKRGKIENDRVSIAEFFSDYHKCKIVIESSTHSLWIYQLLTDMGHKVSVANPSKIPLIYRAANKNDKNDAEKLARLLRLDPHLLCPIQHISMKVHATLAILKTRGHYVSMRTEMINFIRTTVKSRGHRLTSCDAKGFHKRVKEEIPEDLLPAVAPLLITLEHTSNQINEIDNEIKQICLNNYPVAEKLNQIHGVSYITILTFILTIEDPGRFKQARNIGPYLGLTPRQFQSGDKDHRGHISKSGNKTLRTLLVNCVSIILNTNGKDCDLRRFGMQLIEKNENKKKKAKVAVARKLAVTMLAIWQNDIDYDPFYMSKLSA